MKVFDLQRGHRHRHEFAGRNRLTAGYYIIQHAQYRLIPAHIHQWARHFAVFDSVDAIASYTGVKVTVNLIHRCYKLG